MVDLKRERGIFRFDPQKDSVEKIEVRPKVDLLQQELSVLEEKVKQRPLSIEEEKRLWELKKKTGKLDLPESESPTGQYL